MTADLATALNLAKKGFRVFPLEPNSKLPAISKWPAKATCDLAIIKRWWMDPVMGWPQPWGVGVATGQGLIVIDLDTKHDGEASLRLLEFGNGSLKPSLQTKTPSGGRHLYFRTSEPFRNTASKLAPGIDTRGEGGFVVGPGTKINGKVYAIEGGDLEASTETLTSLPDDWAAELRKVSKPREKDRGGNTTPVAPLDTPAAIERATEWLQSQAPLAIEGAGGDTTTYAVAAKVKDFGVSESQALTLMLDHWNERCSPPWDPQELETKVGNAYAYGTSAPGSASPMVDFEPVEIKEGKNPFETPKQHPALFYKLEKDIKLRTKSVALIKDLLDEGTLSVVYGETNVGKSSIVLSMAWAIASSEDWFQFKVRRHGAVVYVATEGGAGNDNRIEAMRRATNKSGIPFALVPCQVDLLKPNADTKPLIELIRDVETETDEKTVLVVIDTLARATAGGDESSSIDMGAFVRNADRIRTETGAHVMVIHHTGKDKAKGARGWSGISGAIDTELEIETGKIKIRKQRDMAKGPPFGFALQVIQLGKDEDGDPISACVAVPANLDAASDFPEVMLTPQQQKALKILKEEIADNGVEPEEIDNENVWGRAVDVGVWRDSCRGTISTGEKRAQNKAFTTARNQIEELGFIEIHEQFVWLKG